MTNEFENLTFEKVPFAIAYLINEVQELKQAVQAQNEQPGTASDGWMNLNELIEYLPDKPARATVYGWVSSRQIPHHKGGKRLRFRRSEINTWLSADKRQSNGEIEASAQTYLTKNRKGI